MPPPIKPGGEADVHGPHDRVDEDELPALLQLVEGLAEVDATAVLSLRPVVGAGSVRREIMNAENRNVAAST